MIRIPLKCGENGLKQKSNRAFRFLLQRKTVKLLGLSSIGPFRNWAGYKYTVENSVYVDAKHRGKGIAKLLMPPIIDAAKNLACTR